MSDIGKQLGHRIRQLRTQGPHRWTQEDVSERAKISVSFLSMIERGERIPHIETLDAIAQALGVRLAELFADRSADSKDANEVLRPLAEFARVQRLTSTDVEKLLHVARVMFNGSTL